MDLSIIIVSFNTRDKLRNCLRSVFNSQTGYSYEVFVVDNASSDGSVEMLKSEFEGVKLVQNERNIGFSAANNLAVRRSFSKYILLLNSDIEVMPDTFEKMVDYMDRNFHVGISGCRVEKPDGSMDLASRRSFPSLASAFFRLSGLSLWFPKSRLASYNLTFLPEDQIAEVDSVMGAFLLIRRDLTDRIGLLDENFFMYGEDLDWCWRAKAVGAKVVFAPITKVIHDKGSSSKKVPERMIYEFHRAMKIFYDKHYRPKCNFFINFLVTFGIWTRYLLKLIENALRREKYVSK